MALDVVGGAWTNATPTTRRWYGRPGAPLLERIVFPLVHVHPFVAEAASGRRRWGAAGTLYGAMLATSVAVAAAPARARLPVALAGVAAGLAASRASGGAPAGWEWLPPAYLVKLAVHGVPAPPRTMRR